MNLLERVPDSLVSIGLDASTLLAFKSHAALSVDPNWTESNALLQSYLLAAERQVDELSGLPYRSRSFTYSVEEIQTYCPGKRRPDYRFCFESWHHKGVDSYWSIPLTMRPITGTPTITWAANNGTSGTWTAGIDFSVYGPTSLTPRIVFPYSFSLPATDGVPYPYVVNFTAGGGPDNAVALVCIFEYAAAYYRMPEAVGEKLSYVSRLFDSNLAFLTGSFL